MSKLPIKSLKASSIFPYVASFLQKYESDMNFAFTEIRSFQQPVSYLWSKIFLYLLGI